MFVKKRIKERLNFTRTQYEYIFNTTYIHRLLKEVHQFKPGFAFSNTAQTKRTVDNYSKSHQQYHN